MQNPYEIGASAEEQELVRACGEQGIAYVPFFTIAGALRLSDDEMARLSPPHQSTD